MKPEVIDLDGGDVAPHRAGAVRAISIVVAFGALIGWAALSSPALVRGPYATPDPAGGVSLAKLDRPRYTIAPFAIIEPASISGALPGCSLTGSAFSTTFFIGGQPATFSRPITVSPDSSCVWFWSGPPLLPTDRFAR